MLGMDILDVGKALHGRRHERIALVGGGFDLFHVGHLDYLEHAAQQGDVLVVQVASDVLLKSQKGINRPVIPEKERQRIVQALACVDFTFISDAVHYDSDTLAAVRPDVIVRSKKPQRPHPPKISGIPVVYIDEAKGIHTSSIITRINSIVETFAHEPEDLAALAKQVSTHGFSYSGTRIGAAVMTENRLVFTGCNVSNASPALTMCAERMAIFRAIAAGNKTIRSVAVYSASDEIVTPCGLCRQVLFEFADGVEVPVFLASQHQSRVQTIQELLPDAYVSSRVRR